MNAQLALRFEASTEETRVWVDTQEPPWKVVRAFRQPDGAALVHLHNVSGGILAGDRLSLHIDVGAGAAAQVTTTGATRLYRHRKGALQSEQHTVIRVAEGGLFEYLPDPLIPFANSRHMQSTDVTLANQASFFGWDVLAPGRQAMGEVFAYERLRLRTALRSDMRPLVLEDYLLEPRVRSIKSPARLGNYRYIATFYAIQVGLQPLQLRELDAMLGEAARATSQPGAIIWGASALSSDGVVVRGLSTTARDLPATLVRFWSIARRFLTGKDAIPPRKMK